MSNVDFYSPSDARGAVALMVLWDLHVNFQPLNSFPEIIVESADPTSRGSDWLVTLKSGPNSTTLAFTAQEMKIASKVFSTPPWKTNNPKWSELVTRVQEAIVVLEAARLSLNRSRHRDSHRCPVV